MNILLVLFNLEKVPACLEKSKLVGELDYLEPHQKGSGTGGGNEA